MILTNNYNTITNSLINKIYKFKYNILFIILHNIKELNKKFNLLNPIDASKGDEYWYIILQKVKDYLSINYEISKFSINDLNGIIIYLEWFKLNWPPKINKKGNYILPKQYQPPEILIN